MGNYVISPRDTDSPRCWDDSFLWKEKNIYVMSNHRLALWCWLQDGNIFDGKYSLIHVDQHNDARRWEGEGEQEALNKILHSARGLKDLNIYQSFQCPTGSFGGERSSRPAITYDNFIHLAAKIKIFDHYYMYSRYGDWNTGLPPGAFTFYKKHFEIFGFSKHLINNPAEYVIDVDLDFFDFGRGLIYRIFEDLLLIFLFKKISKYLSKISVITISINEVPGNELWGKRQRQLKIINRILKICIPVPIMPDGVSN